MTQQEQKLDDLLTLHYDFDRAYKALDSFNGLTSMIENEESEISKTYHLLSPIQWLLYDGITKLNAMIAREEHKGGDNKEVARARPSKVEALARPQFTKRKEQSNDTTTHIY